MRVTYNTSYMFIYRYIKLVLFANAILVTYASYDRPQLNIIITTNIMRQKYKNNFVMNSYNIIINVWDYIKHTTAEQLLNTLVLERKL